MAMNHINQKQSALAKQAEKIFFTPQNAVFQVSIETQQSYGGGLRVVQSFTTYSACEQPIPSPVTIK
jgi:hypothetical protein